MATTESSDQKTVDREENTCPNGYSTCDGSESNSFPCFDCYCEGFEDKRDENTCPGCGTSLEYGALLDSVTGQLGWACDSCNIAYSALQL